MSGAGRVLNKDRQSTVVKELLRPDLNPIRKIKKDAEMTVDDLGKAFGPSQEQLDMMEKQETLLEQQGEQIRQQMEKANEPPPPMPDEYELRRARRRRGQTYGGYSDTVLTDRLGG